MGREMVKLHSKQAIPVSPEIVRKLSGNVTAAYFYQQLQFYDRYEPKNGNGWFVKDSTDIENDTGLNRYKQRRIRELLEEGGMIETRSIRGGKRPAIMFRILIDFSKP